MGVVSRSVNKKKNQELANTRSYRVALDTEAVLERLQQYTEQQNAEIRANVHGRKMGRVERWALDGKPRKVLQYFNQHRDGQQVYIGFAYPIQRLLQGDKNARLQGAWLARMTLTPWDGGTDLQIALLQWSTDGDDGTMKNRSWYENGLLGEFIQALPVSAASTTPAGWYPDPDDNSRQRYWDGQQWTEHYHPAQP